MPNRRPPQGRSHSSGGPNRPRPPRSPRGNRHDDTAPDGEGPERLQKVLAHAGVGSRRACEELILQGRITINGKVVRELGTRVDPRTARIEVDGQRVQLERPVYFAVNKPKGYVSTNNDPSGRPRVIDLLPEIPQRVYSVGRLDEMSVGLMILTNDGELANKLAHPKFGVEKIYRAVVAGTPTREVLDKITEGVWLAEGKARAKHVRIVGHKGEATILEMVLAEGKNREVRRMLAKLGHKVMTLTRVAVGPITLRGLKPGESRPLSGHEVDLLMKVAAGIPVSTGRSAYADRRPDRGPTRGPNRPRGGAPAHGAPPAHAKRPAHRPPQGAPRPVTGSQQPSGEDRPRHRRPPEGARPIGEQGRPAAGSRPAHHRPVGGGSMGGPAHRDRGPGSLSGRPRSMGHEPRPVQEGPIEPMRPRRSSSSREPLAEQPRRKIIGLDTGPAASGPGGIRPRRAGLKRRPAPEPGQAGPRPPRLKRPRRPRPGDDQAEGNS
jgi:23S rRNA pseudouridine2605 synthase